MKLMKKFAVCLVPAFAASLLASCGIFSSPRYQSTQFYDFGHPERITCDYNVDVDTFTSGSSSYGRQRMTYRYSGNQIDNDEYNRWASTPNRLISSYVKLSFAQQSAAKSKDKPTFTVSGIVLACEADVKTKEAILSVAYNINTSNKLDVEYNSSAVIKVKMDEVTPENLASAMSKAADQLVKKLKVEMDELYQKETAELKVKASAAAESGSPADAQAEE